MNPNSITDTASAMVAGVFLRARHFAFGTASLGTLGFDPQHPEAPVIALWNSTPNEIIDHAADTDAGSDDKVAT